LQTKNF